MEQLAGMSHFIHVNVFESKHIGVLFVEGPELGRPLTLRCSEREMKQPVWLLGAAVVVVVVVVKWHRGMDGFSFDRLLHRCYCGNWNHLIRQPCCVISFSACSFYFSVLILSLFTFSRQQVTSEFVSSHFCFFFTCCFYPPKCTLRCMWIPLPV